MMLVKKGPFVKEATGWRRVWSDAGSRARDDVTLNSVPGVGTMWPSVATMHH